MKKISNFLKKHRFIEEYPFGACYCGNGGKYFNVNRTHWFYCDDCKTMWCIGSNLFSGWRSESEKIWEDNKEKYKNYKEIKPVYNSLQRWLKKWVRFAKIAK